MVKLVAPEAARVGDSLEQIGTPALLVDLDAFDASLRQLAALCQSHGVALRPHAKAHKSIAVARLQVGAGAVGICCQKLSEAYPFAAAGIQSIHISNEFVGRDKVAMAVELAAHVRLSVCVDSVVQVRSIGEAAAHAGVDIDVFGEVDVGQHRCGVSTDSALLELVDAISTQSAMRFAGLQAYHGEAQHVHAWNARKAAAHEAAERAAKFVKALDVRGVSCETVTGGGTGTVEFDVASGVYTEVQPGSYLLMDGDYGSLEWSDAMRFRPSLFVLATIMSAIRPGMTVCDVGLKGLAVDSGLPRDVLWASGAGGPALRYVSASDEHGMLEFDPTTLARTSSLLGSRLLLQPGHCDPTVNLYDQFVCLRSGLVEAIWPIDARGLSR